MQRRLAAVHEVGGSMAAFLLEVSLHIGATVDWLHDNRILHLDIKPDNIMLLTSGTARCGFTAMLIDFVRYPFCLL